MPGLARGIPAHGAPRVLLLLRGVHPHRRLDVQPARQVAEGDARRCPGGARSRRSTTSSRPTSGGRTTTASATRTPASSTTSSTRRPDVIRVYLPPDANTLLSVTDHCLRSVNYVNVDRRRQAALAAMADDGAGDQALHRGHRDLGVGEQRRGRGSRRRHGVRGRRADARDARGGEHSARASAGAEGPRDQRRRPDALAADLGAPARALGPGLRRPLHRRSPGHLRLPRLSRGSFTASRTGARTTTTSTCAATRRRGRRRRRSTWSCATISTASTSSRT